MTDTPNPKHAPSGPTTTWKRRDGSVTLYAALERVTPELRRWRDVGHHDGEGKAALGRLIADCEAALSQARGGSEPRHCPHCGHLHDGSYSACQRDPQTGTSRQSADEARPSEMDMAMREDAAVDQFLDRNFEVMSHPDGEVPDNWPEEWDEKPFARIRWAEDDGDPSVGLQGWSGFCLTVDQSGTVLGDLLAQPDSGEDEALQDLDDLMAELKYHSGEDATRQPDGLGKMYRNVRRAICATCRLREENAKLWGWVNELEQIYALRQRKRVPDQFGVYEAAGWMHAELCAALDRGEDPRTMDVAVIKERLDSAIARHDEQEGA